MTKLPSSKNNLPRHTEDTKVHVLVVKRGGRYRRVEPRPGSLRFRRGVRITPEHSPLFFQLQLQPLPFGGIGLVRRKFFRRIFADAFPFPVVVVVADDGDDALGMLRRRKGATLMNQVATAGAVWTPGENVIKLLTAVSYDFS